MDVDSCSLEDVLDSTNQWVKEEQGKYVCVANVHMCMETFDSENYRSVVNSADLVVPDGRPLAWVLSLLSGDRLTQVRGMDLMLSLCQNADLKNQKIGFYGASSETLRLLNNKIAERFPELQVVLSISPPFREMSDRETDRYIAEINESAVDVLFVGLGCPKQEVWMAEHRDRVTCVMFGVGAAFDFVAGVKNPAPRFLQKIGMEWCHRLLSEPKRLWKRYLKHNPRFVFLSVCQLITARVANRKFSRSIK